MFSGLVIPDSIKAQIKGLSTAEAKKKISFITQALNDTYEERASSMNYNSLYEYL